MRIRGENFQKSYLDLNLNILEFSTKAVQVGREKRNNVL